jgi:hypothetical protein
MKSHVAITLLKNGKQHPLELPDDFSIDIDDQNPLFNDIEMFSYPVRMPLNGNRFILGNMDDPASMARPVSLEHTKARILVDNMPFRSGTLVTSDDEIIEGALTMNIAASDHSIEDLIGNLTCRDIPLKDRIPIGEKVGNVKAKISFQYRVKVTWDGKKEDTDISVANPSVSETEFTPQALGFSYPGVCECQPGSKDVAILDREVSYGDKNVVKKPRVTTSFINVADAYPYKPYCNARVAYMHHDVDEDGKTSSSVSDPKNKNKYGPADHWPYWVLDADRPQSGICFYVLYFLDCLFAHLGVSFDNSALMAVEDMRHLCFFTTHCKYDEEVKYDMGYWLKTDHTTSITTADYNNLPDEDKPLYERRPFFENINQVNDWLNSRGTGGSLAMGEPKSLNVEEADFTDLFHGWSEHVKVGQDGVRSITVIPAGVDALTLYADVMTMYANSDNFPEASVQTILDSLFASFGIKFYYDYEKQHVTAYFVRDVFRSQQAPVELLGEVISMNKVSEKITGVRVCYAEESSSKEQRENIRQGKRDYNTDYDYIDYPQDNTITDKVYNEIYRAPKQAGASNNRTCYIDLTTGNAYRIKVNADAQSLSEWHPVLFEVGQFKGVELGDCSDLNEDFVVELSSDFVPLICNDVNYQTEIDLAQGYYENEQYQVSVNDGVIEPILCPYIDEDMEHEFLEQRIRQTLASDLVEYSLDLVLHLIENYDPTNTDDGNSPLQSMDWGLTIAVMRGGGTDANIQTYDPNYDGFGNSKWRMVAGQYALTSDSLDPWGREFDYNGQQEGVGAGERFSLKIRSWKQPSWAPAPLINPDIIDPDTHQVETKIKSRGLFDSFLSEYANFILSRRKYQIQMRCTAAQIASIPENWTRRFRINGLTGYINKLSYSLTAAQGLRDLTIEFFVF